MNTPVKGKVRRALQRVLVGVVVAILALGIFGAFCQFVFTQIDTRAYVPPGQMVDVGGYKLHIYCVGQNPPGYPTVILEQGLGGTSPAWALVQNDVAKTTRVCAYDRAGMGWSDPGPQPRDGQ